VKIDDIVYGAYYVEAEDISALFLAVMYQGASLLETTRVYYQRSVMLLRSMPLRHD